MIKHVQSLIDLPEQVVSAFDAEIRLRNVVRPELGGSDALSINAIEVPGGSGTPFHLHHHCEEAWLVTQGYGALRVADEWYGFSAGDVLHCPAEVPHQVVALGEESLRYLAITAPAVDLTTDNTVLDEFDDDALAAAKAASDGRRRRCR